MIAETVVMNAVPRRERTVGGSTAQTAQSELREDGVSGQADLIRRILTSVAMVA